MQSFNCKYCFIKAKCPSDRGDVIHVSEVNKEYVGMENLYHEMNCFVNSSIQDKTSYNAF